MRLGKLGEQIVLKSELAFKQIRFCGSEPADSKIYYEKKSIRDREARRAYRATRHSIDGINELFMLDSTKHHLKFCFFVILLTVLH